MKTLTSSQFSSFYSGEVIKSPSRVLRAIRFPTSTEYSKSLLLLSHSSQTVCPLGIIPGPVATYADVIRWCAVAPFVKKVFKQKALNFNILLHLSMLHVLMRQWKQLISLIYSFVVTFAAFLISSLLRGKKEFSCICWQTRSQIWDFWDFFDEVRNNYLSIQFFYLHYTFHFRYRIIDVKT